MTPMQITAVNYSVLLGIPALIFVAGIVAWSRRRRA